MQLQKQHADNLGEVIRSARIRRGITQAELSERAGMSIRTLSLYENGNRTPQPEAMDRIKQALKTPAPALQLVEAPPPEPEPEPEPPPAPPEQPYFNLSHNGTTFSAAGPADWLALQLDKAIALLKEPTP